MTWSGRYPRASRAWLRPILFLAALAWSVLVPAEGTRERLPPFWEISAAGQPTSWLLGSLHAARPDFYPLPPALEQAFARAQVLVVEADASDPAAMEAAMPLMTYEPPDGLDRHLRPATWKKLAAITGGSGMDAAQLRIIRPAAVADVLALAALTRHGYQAAAGIDLHFLDEAHADGKPVEQLESVEFQMRVLAGLSDDVADAYVDGTLDEIRSGELYAQMDAMSSAWRSGDLDTLRRLLEQERDRDAPSRQLFRVLFDQRNTAMAERITRLARAGKPLFIIIGAGHMVGTDNIPDLLRRRGFAVRRLP